MRLRVLVTGSRSFEDEELIHRNLTALLTSPNVEVLTVVHGACPTGADHWAHTFCTTWRSYCPFLGKDVIEEKHPAAWNAYGKKAGPIRNGDMVRLGADLVLAYPDPHYSPGTRDCMDKATMAGIAVWDMTTGNSLPTP